MDAHTVEANSELCDIIDADRHARKKAADLIQNIQA
jgi:hypothetical protein